MIVFYWMLDVAAYNSGECYMEKEPHAYKGNQKQQKFLSVLSEEVFKPIIERRFLAQQTKLRKHVVVCMGTFVSEQTAGPSQHGNICE